MNFRNINKFNVIVNAVSGNFYPLTDEKTNLSFGNSIYAIFTWIVNIMYVFSTTIGLLFYVPAMEAFQKGGTTAIICVEMLSLSIYFNSQREHLRILIHKINSILVDSDDLARCVYDTVEPHKERLKLYTFAAIGSIIIWAGMPIINVLENDQFIYSHYTLPSYVPGAPVTTSVFIICVLTQTIGSSYIMLKKIGIDVYVSYFITLLTAEYRYIQEKMAAALEKKDEKSVIEALKKCIDHHCNTMEYLPFVELYYFVWLARDLSKNSKNSQKMFVLYFLIIFFFRTGEMLVDILSVNVGLTYLNCICRFCFSAFTVITLPQPYLGKFLIVMFTLGSMMQVYMLCSCIQELLEASTSIVDGAFYEDWYGRGPIVRSIFRTIGLSNRIECRLSAFRIVDLTVPTFATILNQAYSACLLLLKAQ